jgi:hypothetical protein
MALYWFMLGVLGVWRITHLLNAEDGPWEIVARFRRRLGIGLAGSLFACFYCLSLWVAAPFSLMLGDSWRETFLLWLALSGGASLLERWSARSDAVLAAPYSEDKEAGDGVLRPRDDVGSAGS